MNFLIRYVVVRTVAVVLISMLIAVLFWGCGEDEMDQEVTFSDSLLEYRIRDNLGKPMGPITRGDLAGLLELYLAYLQGGSSCIYELTGIEHCTNLQVLSLDHNRVSDICLLSNLVNLEWLSLHNNWVSDISPLSGLVNLERLSLSDNQISDISPLRGLVNLEELWMSNNQISDISPLGSLVNLEVLILSDNQISDISPLGSLVNLKVLHLGVNPQDDKALNIHIPALQAMGVLVYF
jgi:hypothetical protein